MQWITVVTPPFADIEQFDRVMQQVGTEPDGLRERYVGSTADGLRGHWASWARVSNRLGSSAKDGQLLRRLAIRVDRRHEGVHPVVGVNLPDPDIAGVVVVIAAQVEARLDEGGDTERIGALQDDRVVLDSFLERGRLANGKRAHLSCTQTFPQD